MKGKISSGIKYLGFCAYIFGVPMLLYFFAKWDPFLGLDDEGSPKFLGVWPITIVYWVLIFLVYKYNDERKRYKYALEKILLLDRPLSVEEKIEIHHKVLEIPKWEIDNNGKIKNTEEIKLAHKNQRVFAAWPVPHILDTFVTFGNISSICQDISTKQRRTKSF